MVRVFSIIVVYKAVPLQTSSFLTVRAARDRTDPEKLELKILLYDNSPDHTDPASMPAGVEYVAAPENAGLASAYNKALVQARAEGYDWLLTLDQDTDLPPNFLVRLTDIATAAEVDESIGAIVPIITEHGRVHSPNWFLAGALPRYFPPGVSGIVPRDVFAFNSAATLRVSAVYEAGGYNPWFWLDFSDAYIFRQLHRHRKRVYIAGDIEVLHNYSLTDAGNRMSLTRYKNMRAAESAFWDLEMGFWAGVERTMGLLRLAVKHILFGESPEFRATTLEFLKRRLFWSKRRRLKAWRTETQSIFPRLADTRLPPYI